MDLFRTTRAYYGCEPTRLFRYCSTMLHREHVHKHDHTLAGPEMCMARFGWIVRAVNDQGPLIARDPAPNDPDVYPIREPEPEPDTPEPDPGDGPERIDPVHTATNSWSLGSGD